VNNDNSSSGFRQLLHSLTAALIGERMGHLSGAFLFIIIFIFSPQ
jgi:hypothetical protein